MMEQEMAVALQETIDRSKSNTHRIDDLEREQRAIHDLATSVAVMAQTQTHMQKDIAEVKDTISSVAMMAQEQGHMQQDISGLKSSVDTLVAKPGRRWGAVVDKIITVLVAAVLAWLLGQLGIK